MKRSNQNHSRPTIGFLAKNLCDGYEVQIWRGVLQAAAGYDFNLFSYSHDNTTFHLIDKNRLDGIITVSGTIDWSSNEHGGQWFNQYYSAFPTLCIGQDVPGFPSLLVDNETGLSQLIEHIIVVHNRRKIAFIRGPETSMEAEARYQVYREVLAKHGIAFDETFVVNGRFSTEDGIRAVQTLYNQRQLKPDAIVAANDYMGIYAIKELVRMGYRVPDDVIVTGFDDVKEALYTTPSLSTVRQPLAEMGQKSVEMINDMIKGIPVESVFLPTCPVYRASCGCKKGRPELRVFPTLPTFSVDAVSTPVKHGQENALNQIARGLNGRFAQFQEIMDDGWPMRLLNPLQKIGPDSKNAFLAELEHMIQKGADFGIDESLWYAVVREIEAAMANYHGKALPKDFFYELRADAFEEIGMALLQLQTERQQKYGQRQSVIYHLWMLIISTFDIQSLMSNMANFLPELKIRNYFLSHYPNVDKTQAKLTNYFNFSPNVAVENEQAIFPSKYLVPGSFSKDGSRYSYIVLPTLQVGFVAFEIENLGDFEFGPQIDQICIIVRMAALINTIFYYLNDLESKVEERTQQLKEAQEQLIATAHQAGMAEIAIGVMHNVGNLLNSVGISSEAICQIVDDSKIDALLKANELLDAHRQDLAGFFTEDPKAGLLPGYYQQVGRRLKSEQNMIKEETGQLMEKVSMIRDIITTLQDYARSDLNKSMQELTSVAVVIETALKIQEGQIVKNRVIVNKEFMEMKPCMVEKMKLANILVNLIKNAIEAMRTTPVEERKLLIRLTTDDHNNVSIQITDNGEGIAKEQLNKIFTYGYTTKADGHGFGLHICSNYMREMGGKLFVRSDGPGKGATFGLTLPLND